MEFFRNLNDDLKNALSTIKKDNFELDDAASEKHEAITTILASMQNNSSAWDSSCTFNIYKHGKRFEGIIKNLSIDTVNRPYYSDKIDELFYICLMFLVEYYLVMDFEGYEIYPGDSLGELVKELMNRAFYGSPSSEKDEFYIRYAFYHMPIRILNFYMGQEGFSVFLKFNDRKQELENKLIEYQVELDKKLDIVEVLNKRLEKQETAFNFVGLSQGFQAILTKKNNARNWTFGILCVMLMATLTPVGFSFWKFTQGEELSWQKMLPVIGLEFVLIYFFRVVLSHYNSIQTQIMQLELRQSLCQFIQNYAEYAKEMKANDGVSLEKFENLIFSSILSNPDKVPGTFDGVESLTALVKELRGGK